MPHTLPPRRRSPNSSRHRLVLLATSSALAGAAGLVSGLRLLAAPSQEAHHGAARHLDPGGAGGPTPDPDRAPAAAAERLGPGPQPAGLSAGPGAIERTGGLTASGRGQLDGGADAAPPGPVAAVRELAERAERALDPGERAEALYALRRLAVLRPELCAPPRAALLELAERGVRPALALWELPLSGAGRGELDRVALLLEPPSPPEVRVAAAHALARADPVELGRVQEALERAFVCETDPEVALEVAAALVRAAGAGGPDALDRLLQAPVARAPGVGERLSRWRHALARRPADADFAFMAAESPGD